MAAPLRRSTRRKSPPADIDIEDPDRRYMHWRTYGVLEASETNPSRATNRYGDRWPYAAIDRQRAIESKASCNDPRRAPNWPRWSGSYESLPSPFVLRRSARIANRAEGNNAANPVTVSCESSRSPSFSSITDSQPTPLPQNSADTSRNNSNTNPPALKSCLKMPATGSTRKTIPGLPFSRPKYVLIFENELEQRRFHIEEDTSGRMPGPIFVRRQTEADLRTIAIPLEKLLENIHDLKQDLRALSLDELHVQFYLLQKLLRQFGRRHFSQKWTAERTAAFPLASLPADYPAFYRMMAFIADGSGYQSGWHDFLTSEHTRPHIVYAVLGEWLQRNVFEHSCFGLSAEEDAEMQEIDVRYLHWDGFVRTKERTQLLTAILDRKPAWQLRVDVTLAVADVVSDLLVVLEPILPDGEKELLQLHSHLHSLVELAANLHQCIRLTGVDGTIIKFLNKSKDDTFIAVFRQNCVNKAAVRSTLAHKNVQRSAQPDAPPPPNMEAAADLDAFAYANQLVVDGRDASLKDQLIIKMPCFPLVEALVPCGPTLKDYVVEQARYEDFLRSRQLPVRRGKHPLHIDDVPMNIVRAAYTEEVEEDAFQRYGAFLPPTEKGTKKRKEFRSYVRKCILNEWDVYCEWEFLDEKHAPGKKLALSEAVLQAQRERYGYIPAARRQRRKQIGRRAKYMATAAVAAATAYGILSRTGTVDAVVLAVKKLELLQKFSIKNIRRKLELPQNLAVGDVKSAVSSAMQAAIARTKTSQQLAARVFKGYKIGNIKSAVSSAMRGAAARTKRPQQLATKVHTVYQVAEVKKATLSDAFLEAIKSYASDEGSAEPGWTPKKVAGPTGKVHWSFI